MEETKEPIKEEEMDKFVHKEVKIDYHEQLKDLIRNSVHGTKIAICSNITKSASIDALVESYEQNMGYEFSKGNVVLDEVLLERAAMPFYNAVSKELGVEISNLSDKQLSQIIRFKINDDPEVFARKMQQISEDGHLANVHYTNENLNINKETKTVSEKVEYYIFTEQSIANAKKVNDYGELFDKFNSETTKSADDIVNKTIDSNKELGIGQDLQEILNQSQVDLSTHYDYDLIQLIQLVKDVKYADYFSKDILRGKAYEYVKKHPKLKDAYAEMIQDDTKLPEKYITMINEYENEANLMVAISTVSTLKKEDINSLSSADRKLAVLNIINGMKEETFGLTNHPELIDMLEKLAPDLDFRDENGEKDIRNVLNNEKEREKLKKYLPISQKEELTNENLNNTFKSASLYNIKNISRDTLEKAKRENKFDMDLFTGKIVSDGFLAKIRNRKRDKIADELVSELFKRNVEELDINFNDKSLEERFFSGSAMKLTETDAKKMRKMYENTTVKCWISSKKDYLELRYSALNQIKSDLDGKESLTELEKDRLQLINMRLDEFKERHPNVEDSITFENDEGKRVLIDEAKASLEMYQDYKVKSKLITTFMENSMSITNREDYENLSDRDKKRYLKDAIAGLDYKRDDDKIISKFAKRSLEILNSGDDKFISVEAVRSDDDNYIRYNSILNKKRILEEYNKYSMHKFTSYKELKEYCCSNKNMYVADKLDEYELLQDEDFVKADGNTLKDKVKFIEKQKQIIEERELRSPKKTQTNRRVSTIRIAREERENKEKNIFGNRNNEKESRPKEGRGPLEIDEIKIPDKALKLNEESEIKPKLGGIDEDQELESENELPVPVKDGFIRKIVNKIKEVLFKSKEEGNQEKDKESISTNQHIDEKDNSELDSWIPKVSIDYSKVVSQSQNGAITLQDNSTKETEESMEER